MAPQTQTRTIIVKVDTPATSGLKAVADQMKVLNQNAKLTSSSVNTLKNAFLGLVGVFGISLGLKNLEDIADGMLSLSDRLTILTGSSEKAKETLSQLAIVANNVKAPIVELGEAYNKYALATKTLGFNSEQLLSIIQTLVNTYKLSGQSSAQAVTSTETLARAFTKGYLSGRELQSIIRTNTVLANEIKKSMGEAGLSTADFGKKTLPLSILLKTLNENFDDTQKNASKLHTTFSQSLTVAYNELSVAVGKLNEQFKLSDKFESFVHLVVTNGPTIAAILGGLATLTIPLLIAAIERLTIAALAFTVSNPITIFISLIATAILLVIANFDRLKLRFEQIAEGIIFLFDKILQGVSFLVEGFGRLTGNPFIATFAKSLKVDLANGADVAAGKVKSLQTQIQSLNNTQKGSVGNNIPTDVKDLKKPQTIAEQIKALRTAIGSLNTQFNDGAIGVDSFNSSLDILTTKLLKLELSTGRISLAKYNEEILKLKKADLGREFDKGRLGIDQYEESLRRLRFQELNNELATGKISLFKFNEEVIKLKREDLGADFEHGIVSIDDFNTSLKALQLDEVTNKFKNGKITALEYHQEVLKLSNDFQPGSALYVGVNAYIESSGTLSQNIAKNITLVFNTLEDTLVNFIKTGTFEFAKFTQAILDDLTRIVVRAAIVQPLAGGILGLLNSTPALAAPAGSQSFGAYENTTGAGTAVAAKGYAPNGTGVSAFANGGIVHSPTYFKYGSGSTGVMGEAGPEAILPLTRGANGKLGVSGGGSNVQVIINNQTGGEVTQKESTNSGGDKVIDILITNKVKDAFANGSLDKTLANIYGVRRKGN